MTSSSGDADTGHLGESGVGAEMRRKGGGVGGTGINRRSGKSAKWASFGTERGGGEERGWLVGGTKGCVLVGSLFNSGC